MMIYFIHPHILRIINYRARRTSESIISNSYFCIWRNKNSDMLRDLLLLVIIQEWIETSDCQVISPFTGYSLFSLLLLQRQEKVTFGKTMYFEERNNAAGKWEKKLRLLSLHWPAISSKSYLKQKTNKQTNPRICWMASLTQWTWVWENSGSWWWTGRPGVLQFMGSQRVGHDWATELNIWNFTILLT